MLMRMAALVAALVAGPALSAVAWAEVPLTLDGNFEQGSIIRGVTDPGATVVFAGTTLPVNEQGQFVFGLGRNQESPSVLSVTLPDGEHLDHSFDVASREYVIQRVEGVPQETVTPPDEVLERIGREAAQKREARAPVTMRDEFASEFVWPLTGPISGTYGSQRFYNGEPRNPHMGIDIARPSGTEVVAPAAGVVTLAEPDMYFEGGLIFIDHGHGMIDVFMHLSEVSVEVGQEVAQGEVIGLVGSGGRATGAHLDWRMYVMGTRVDPSNLVGPMPTSDSEETGVGGE